MGHKWKEGDVGENSEGNWFIVGEQDTYEYLVSIRGGRHQSGPYTKNYSVDCAFSEYAAECIKEGKELVYLFNILDIHTRYYNGT